jgi:hypothetical protein
VDVLDLTGAFFLVAMDVLDRKKWRPRDYIEMARGAVTMTQALPIQALGPLLDGELPA